MPSSPRPPEALLKRVGSPMLAVLQPDLEAMGPGPWVFELKYDGFRALGAVSGDQALLESRNGNDLAGRFPEVATALRSLKAREAVVDGGIVAEDAEGRSDFSLLSQEGTRRLVLFDLLWLDGEDLRSRPLEERRKALKKLLGRGRRLGLSERLEGPAAAALKEASRRGAEGVVAKRANGKYEGTRSPDWQKLKTRGGQELAIVGYTPTSTGARGIGALLLAVAERGGFAFAGKVGTGFDEAMRRKLEKLLAPLRISEPPVSAPPKGEPQARWVKPRYVAQVAFTEWTPDGRLRHPSFQGLRDDKRPEETGRELLARRKEPTRRVTLTHPDRLVFPEAGLTKADVSRFYEAVAPALLPVLRDRPLTLEQFPRGVEGGGFIRQNIVGAPAWLKTVAVRHEGRVVHHVTANDLDSLLWLANQNTITLHGWSSRVPHLDRPQWVIFDLDPGEGTFATLIEVALTLRGLLEQLGLESFPKTSGKRGLHVLVPVSGIGHAQATDFAVAVMGTLARGLPQLATTERSKAKRGGKLYLDAFQNGFGKTVCLPYSLRPLANAPVSTPLRWSEVTRRLDPARFTVRTLLRRLEKQGDLFAPVLTTQQRLPSLKRDATLARSA